MFSSLRYVWSSPYRSSVNSPKTIHIYQGADVSTNYGEPTNPLDIRGQGSVHLPEIIRSFLDDDRYGVIVVSLGVAAIGDISKKIARPLVKWAEHVEKPIVVLWMGNRLNNDGLFSDDDGRLLLGIGGRRRYSIVQRPLRNWSEKSPFQLKNDNGF